MVSENSEFGVDELVSENGETFKSKQKNSNEWREFN